jgi:MFS family permease
VPDLEADGRRLFLARALRMLAYGGLSVVLVVYLDRIGIASGAIGLILALTLLGDTAISLLLTTHADRIGRRRVLIAGALLMAGAAAVFASTDIAAVLVVAATIGVISPSGKEVGPFLAVEQASLTRLVSDARRTGLFAWYNLVGAVAAAIGALAAGVLVQSMLSAGADQVAADRSVVVAYGLCGLLLAGIFIGLTRRIEVPAPERATVRGRLGLHRSTGIVARLSGLFALDAFGGGFVMDSIVAFWFTTRWDLSPVLIGAIFFGANLLAAVSSLAAARLAARFGLVNTMVFTHLPSNILLMLIPIAPSAWLAVALLLCRMTISQMDVPTRQSYTMAVVAPDERSAAAGITGIARTIGAAFAAFVAAPLVATPGLAGLPFLIGGAVKIVYDVSLWVLFRARPAPEEVAAAPAR